MFGKLLSNSIGAIIKGREERLDTRIQKAKKAISLNAKARTAAKLENLASKGKKGKRRG